MWCTAITDKILSNFTKPQNDLYMYKLKNQRYV